ncbi:MAG: hypothetical protein IH859_10205 [Chloroflexi bacterium]|nr:hypothetical protein [Chloroflexota bacterium]
MANDESKVGVSDVDTISVLEKKLAASKEDFKRITILNNLALQYLDRDVGEAFRYASKGLFFSQKLSSTKGIIQSYLSLGTIYEFSGNIHLALINFLKVLKLKKQRYFSLDSMMTPNRIASALLSYQQAWLADDSPVKVWEKSRRIGASWCEASDAALYAAGESGGDTWYIGYNKEMAEEFIGDCAFLKRVYQLAADEMEEDVLEDIRAFRMDKGVAKIPETARTRDAKGDKRHGDAGIALALAHYASRQEAIVYEYHRVPPRENDGPGWDDPRPRDIRVSAGFGLKTGTW